MIGCQFRGLNEHLIQFCCCCIQLGSDFPDCPRLSGSQCFPREISNSSPFHFQKQPSLYDKFFISSCIAYLIPFIYKYLQPEEEERGRERTQKSPFPTSHLLIQIDRHSDNSTKPCAYVILYFCKCIDHSIFTRQLFLHNLSNFQVERNNRYQFSLIL